MLEKILNKTKYVKALRAELIKQEREIRHLQMKSEPKLTKCAAAILEVLHLNEFKSNKELAAVVNRSVNTVNGAIGELKRLGLVKRVNGVIKLSHHGKI